MALFVVWALVDMTARSPGAISQHKEARMLTGRTDKDVDEGAK